MRKVLAVVLLIAPAMVFSACQARSPQGEIAGLSAQGGTAEPSRVAGTPTAAPVLTTEVVSNLVQPLATLTPTAAPQPPASPTSTSEPPTSTLLFTGIIVPARCVQAGIDARGNPNYPYEEVRDLISAADLAVGTLNATISDYPPRTGCTDTFVLTGGAQNAEALRWAGFDAVSAATNHIKNCGLMNCGDRAFLDTLMNLQQAGVVPVGAGENLVEALQPAIFTINGVRFGLISLGQIEPMAFAGDESPGIAPLTLENLKAAMDAARQVSDVVIVMPHWGPEYVATPNWIQRNLAREIVALGADLVVGNHTHVVQGLQEIDGVPVFYGLGNFVFDQYWQADLYQSVILRVTFRGTRFSGYELIPARSDRDGHVQLAGPEEAAQVLERIREASEPLQ